MSTLHRSAAEYLAIRRAGGFILLDHDSLLADFADYLEQEHATWVTVQAAMAWATLDETASIGVLTSRLSAVRRFARYMRSLDERTEVPPVNLLPARRRRRNTPYLYSSAEIGALMTAASSLLSLVPRRTNSEGSPA
jgi:integrase/recombinase XerD